jgi:hypothetical protein
MSQFYVLARFFEIFRKFTAIVGLYSGYIKGCYGDKFLEEIPFYAAGKHGNCIHLNKISWCLWMEAFLPFLLFWFRPLPADQIIGSAIYTDPVGIGKPVAAP